MTLVYKDSYFYGDTADELREVLVIFSREHAKWAKHFADAICVCGSRAFRLFLDQSQHVAVRMCLSCEQEVGMLNSEWNDGDPLDVVCNCGGLRFEIVAAVAEGRKNPARARWVFLGCRCLDCRCMGCYADWCIKRPIPEVLASV